MSSGPVFVRSDFVFVAGDADDIAHVVIFVIFIGFEEGIVVIAFDFDIVIADIGDIVAGSTVIGVFERNQFDFGVFGIDFGNLVLILNFSNCRGFFEEGQG